MSYDLVLSYMELGTDHFLCYCFWCHKIYTCTHIQQQTKSLIEKSSSILSINELEIDLCHNES